MAKAETMFTLRRTYGRGNAPQKVCLNRGKAPNIPKGVKFNSQLASRLE